MADPNMLTELTRLIDIALDIAASDGIDPGNPDRLLLVRASDMLRDLKAQAMSGELEPSHGINSLGLVHGFADETADLESPMMHALGAIEHHYQTKM